MEPVTSMHAKNACARATSSVLIRFHIWTEKNERSRKQKSEHELGHWAQEWQQVRPRFLSRRILMSVARPLFALYWESECAFFAR